MGELVWGQWKPGWAGQEYRIGIEYEKVPDSETQWIAKIYTETRPTEHEHSFISEVVMAKKDPIAEFCTECGRPKEGTGNA